MGTRLRKMHRGSAGVPVAEMSDRALALFRRDMEQWVGPEATERYFTENIVPYVIRQREEQNT